MLMKDSSGCLSSFRVICTFSLNMKFKDHTTNATEDSNEGFFILLFFFFKEKSSAPKVLGSGNVAARV